MSLLGRTVTHGNLTGKVVAVTPTFVSVEDRSNPGMVVKVPVPAHLQAALEHALEDSDA